MSDKAKWCRCESGPSLCAYWCECSHHFARVDLDSIPTALYSCPVCKALVADDWIEPDRHLEWHEKRGDLES